MSGFSALKPGMGGGLAIVTGHLAGLVIVLFLVE
jgi:hypothetical protein